MMRLAFAAVMGVLLAALAGCGTGLTGLTGVIGGGGPSGDLRIQSLGTDPVTLSGRFNHALYANGDAVEWSILLSDIEPTALADGTVTSGRIVHIELLWIPRAGSTPIEITSTNASVRYIIITDGEVGVYGGAGFAVPSGHPGDERLTVSIRHASLRLLHRTDGFADLLTPAHLSGTVTAQLDSRGAKVLHHAASQFVTDAFGRSIIVDFGQTGRETDHRVAVADHGAD